MNTSARVTKATDGTSWEQPFRDLQDAIDAAETGDEIWVAAGTYRPTHRVLEHNSQTVTFLISGKDVRIYGGFAGWETALNQRELAHNETILSGDLGGNDDPDVASEPTSNCCFGHDTPDCDDTTCEAIVCRDNPWCCRTIVPGFRWDDSCARQAEFLCCELCTAGDRCENAYHVVTLHGTSKDTLLSNLTITGGHARHYDTAAGEYFGSGGGIVAREGSLTLQDSRLVLNAAAGSGGGMQAISDVDVFRTRFGGNWAGFSGGAMDLNNSDFISDNCTFVGNRAGSSGGAVRVFAGDLFIEKGVFVGNSAPSGGALYGGRALIVYKCVFVGNEAEGWGAAILSTDGFWLANSLVVDNAGGFRGAVAIGFGTAYVTESTIVFNRGSGVYLLWQTGALIEDCVVWGNRVEESDPPIPIEWAQVPNQGGGGLEIGYSLIEGWSGMYGGVGNSGDDPLFVDALGPDGLPGTGDEDFRVSPHSPAIDAGNPDLVIPPNLTDLDGVPRVLCDRLDIGAYEFGIGDYDCNRYVDLLDFSAWESCMTGPGPSQDGPSGDVSWTALYPPGCESFDSENDGDTDLLDLSVFQLQFLSAGE